MSYFRTCQNCAKTNCKERIVKAENEDFYDNLSIALKCNKLYKAVKERMIGSARFESEVKPDPDDDWRYYPDADTNWNYSRFGIKLADV